MLKEPFEFPGEEAYKHGLLQGCLRCVMGWQVVPVIKLLPLLQTHSPVLRPQALLTVFQLCPLLPTRLLHGGCYREKPAGDKRDFPLVPLNGMLTTQLPASSNWIPRAVSPARADPALLPFLSGTGTSGDSLSFQSWHHPQSPSFKLRDISTSLAVAPPWGLHPCALGLPSSKLSGRTKEHLAWRRVPKLENPANSDCT